MKFIGKKHYFSIGILGAFLMLLTACEDVIDFETKEAPSLMVVDGWITNQPGPQTVTLTWSTTYFNGETKAVTGADVSVTDDAGNVFVFDDLEGNGVYTWGQGKADTLARLGRTYVLHVKNGAEEYLASNVMKRVPTIDSIVYQKETLPFKPEKGPKDGFEVQFYARDFEGVGDMYWIKPIVSGQVQISKVINISLAYDAAYNAGSPSDGLIFIQPLRTSITRDSLFSAGHSVGVELHSINEDGFNFLKQLREQASNGGLFATPVVNVKSNVKNLNPQGPRALGFFGTSAVTRMETIIDPEKARPED
jgi:hypothetical protein